MSEENKNPTNNLPDIPERVSRSMIDPTMDIVKDWLNQLKEHRKTFEKEPTPAQFKDTKPIGQRTVTTVSNIYVLDQMKVFSHELFSHELTGLQLVTLLKDDGSYYKQAVLAEVKFTDRSTGNTVVGADMALIQTSKGTGEPIDPGSNVAAAVTGAIKQCGKYLGIAADTFEREVFDLPPELQERINLAWDLTERLGSSQLKGFREKLHLKLDLSQKELSEWIDDVIVYNKKVLKIN